MTFDPNKPTDVETMSTMDFAVWRTGKQNEVRYVVTFFVRRITYILLRSFHTPPEDLSTSPPGP